MPGPQRVAAAVGTVAVRATAPVQAVEAPGAQAAGGAEATVDRKAGTVRARMVARLAVNQAAGIQADTDRVAPARAAAAEAPVLEAVVPGRLPGRAAAEGLTTCPGTSAMAVMTTWSRANCAKRP